MTDSNKKPNMFGYEGAKYSQQNELLADVSNMLTDLGPEKTISVNTLTNEFGGITSVIVWYWDQNDLST